MNCPNVRAMAHPPQQVSIHVRAFITWLTIFPLVALGLTFLLPALGDTHPILKAFVLTLIVVPLAVYVIIPRLLGLYVRLSSRKKN
jgi:antibiotic biosynthesis monooxygenase (ABM) superfamily enzyme